MGFNFHKIKSIFASKLSSQVMCDNRTPSNKKSINDQCNACSKLNKIKVLLATLFTMGVAFGSILRINAIS